jgi:hypothetical protein
MWCLRGAALPSGTVELNLEQPSASANLYCIRFNPHYDEQYPASSCIWSTHCFGSLHSVGHHGLHCPLSSCKRSLRKNPRSIMIQTDHVLPQLHLSPLSFLTPPFIVPRTREQYCGSMCSLQFPPPRLVPFSCCSLPCEDSPFPLGFATRR